jgi:hypothetical protein
VQKKTTRIGGDEKFPRATEPARLRESLVYINLLAGEARRIKPAVFRVPKDWRMSDFLIFLLMIALWFFLQAWFLPRLGVST